MQDNWKIVKIILAWIIGVFAILFSLIGFFGMTFWLTKVFSGLLAISGLYLIPPINRKLNFGIPTKYITIFLLICFFGIPISEINEPDTSKKTEIQLTKKYYITTNVLNVREGKGKDFKVIKKLKKGDKINVVSNEGEWTQISLEDGKIGYVSSEFISNKPKDNKEKSSWLGYIAIGGFIFLSMFSKGSKSDSSNNTNSSRKSVTEKKSVQKEKVFEPVFICRYCGFENKNLGTLTFCSCSKSPTGKHIPYDKGVQPLYYCKHCGYKNKNLGTLTFCSCSNSPTGRHEPL